MIAHHAKVGIVVPLERQRVLALQGKQTARRVPVLDAGLVEQLRDVLDEQLNLVPAHGLRLEVGQVEGRVAVGRMGEVGHAQPVERRVAEPRRGGHNGGPHKGREHGQHEQQQCLPRETPRQVPLGKVPRAQRTRPPRRGVGHASDTARRRKQGRRRGGDGRRGDARRRDRRQRVAVCIGTLQHPSSSSSCTPSSASSATDIAVLGMGNPPSLHQRVQGQTKCKVGRVWRATLLTTTTGTPSPFPLHTANGANMMISNRLRTPLTHSIVP